MLLPRLLIIDDDALVRRALARCLGQGFSIVCAESAESALVMHDRGERFDAILCDLNLAGISGQDFYERLMRRATGQAARLVIMTGELPRNDDAFATAMGDRYLTKPLDRDELVAALSGVAFPRVSTLVAPAPLAAA